MTLNKERQIAVDVVAKACRLCETVAKSLISHDTVEKKDKSPVTVADFSSQAVIFHALTRAFPKDRYVGEEDAAALRADDVLREKVVRYVRECGGLSANITSDDVLTSIDHGADDGGKSGRFWTLDPIDGTKGFLRKDQYAVALALLIDGKVQLGVLGCPRLSWVDHQGRPTVGAIFVAERGQGAFVRPIEHGEEFPVSVASIVDPAHAIRCESVEKAHSEQDAATIIAKRLGMTAPPLRIDSQVKYGVVARGDATMYLRLPTRKDYVERIWDHAAGVVLVEEAGGCVTDIDGKPFDFSLGRGLSGNRGVLATNKRIHEAVLSTVSAVWRERELAAAP